MMAIQMASLGFSPLLPAMQQDLGASYSQIGLFTGMYGIIALLVSLPAGVFAARIGEKRALLIGLAVTAVGLAALSQATRYDVALAFRALWLVGYRTAFIGVFTAMAMVTPEKYRSRTMGILGAMAAFASVIGAPFGTRAGSVAWMERRHSRVSPQSLFSARSFSACSIHRQRSQPSGPAGSHGTSITRDRRGLRSSQPDHLEHDSAGPHQHGRLQRDLFRAVCGEVSLRHGGSGRRVYHQCQLPGEHPAESGLRLPVRPVFPLEHDDLACSAFSSRELCSHVARPSGLPHRRRTDCFPGPRRYQPDLCDR